MSLNISLYWLFRLFINNVIMESTVKQRVIEFFVKEEITVNSIYKTLGIPQKTLNNQINGNSEIGIKTVSAISDLYPKLSADWLLSGKGEMLKIENMPSNIEVEQLNDRIKELEIQLKYQKEIYRELLLDKLVKKDVEGNMEQHREKSA